MEKRLTKKDFFKKIREMVEGRQDLIDFIDHELELLDKKSSSRGQTKTQKENEEIKTKIVNALIEIARPVTITELQENNEEMATYSNQKLSALLKKLVDTNQVIKVIDKKKSYFSVVD